MLQILRAHQAPCLQWLNPPTRCLSDGTTNTEVGSGQQRSRPRTDRPGCSGPVISVISQSNLSPMTTLDRSFWRSSLSTFSLSAASLSSFSRRSWASVSSSSLLSTWRFCGETRIIGSSWLVLYEKLKLVKLYNELTTSSNDCISILSCRPTTKP